LQEFLHFQEQHLNFPEMKIAFGLLQRLLLMRQPLLLVVLLRCCRRHFDVKIM
jgi:hypothetical protein